jgi:SpoVK/Ycf46/Vps4 family AAA+-type ATPase
MEFHEELRALFRANASLIQVTTHEWERLRANIQQAAGEEGGEGGKCLFWNPSQGLLLRGKGSRPMKKEELEIDDKKSSALNKVVNAKQMIEWYIGNPRLQDKPYPHDSVLVIEDLTTEETQFDYMKELLQFCARVNRENATKKNKVRRTIILVTPKLISIPEVEKEMQVLDLPLPGFKTIELTMKRAISEENKRRKKEGEEVLKNPNAEETEGLVEAAKGLSIMETQLAFALAIAKTGQLSGDEIPLVIEAKKQAIKQSGILEFIEPDETMSEIGGLDLLTDWLNERKWGFSSEARKNHHKSPSGIMLLGFPGCGKSLTARHLQQTWKFPLIRLDVGRVFSERQGASESNMRSVFKTAEAVSPCILWIDEIEKAFSGSGSSDRTDGGTSSRVLGSFLTWMQEKTAPVFVFATCNNISGLPPEFSRKGRWDEVFFVDLPRAKERKDIFKVHINKRDKDLIKEFNLDELVNLSQGFSGAEIAVAVENARFRAGSQGRRIENKDIRDFLGSDEMFPMVFQEHQRNYIEKLRARIMMYKPANKGKSEPLPDNPHGSIPWTDEEHDADPFRDKMI